METLKLGFAFGFNNIIKFMKYTIILFCLFLSQISFGQLKGAIPQKEIPAQIKKDKTAEPTTPTAIAKNSSEKLAKSLKLNANQQKSLYDALLDFESNVSKINKSKLTNKEKYLKVNELNKGKTNSLKTILTKEQYSAYISSFP